MTLCLEDFAKRKALFDKVLSFFEAKAEEVKGAAAFAVAAALPAHAAPQVSIGVNIGPEPARASAALASAVPTLTPPPGGPTVVAVSHAAECSPRRPLHLACQQ